MTGIDLIIISIIGIAFIIFGLFSKPKQARILPDMIPFKMHGVNVRSRLSDTQWNDLRNFAKRKKRFRCGVCGQNGRQQGFKHDVEAHEQWAISARTQKLTDILILCPLCHKFKHIGLADSQGYGDQVREHIQRVNNWTADQVEAAINRARAEVKSLKGAFNLDLTYLNSYPLKFDGIVFTEQENRYCRKGVYE